MKMKWLSVAAAVFAVGAAWAETHAVGDWTLTDGKGAVKLAYKGRTLLSNLTVGFWNPHYKGMRFAGNGAACVRSGDVVTFAQYHAATGSVETSAGTVWFREETGYPFAGGVRVTVLEAPKGEVTFRFFAPSYVKTDEPVKDGFVERRGVFRPGETLAFDFALREHVDAGRRFRGPLLLGRRGDGAWEPVYHLMSPEIWEKGSGALRVLEGGADGRP